MSQDRLFRAEPLTRAIAALAAAGGSDLREAELVAANLVEANLQGHDSHGIGMMPRYVAALLEGGLHANRHVAVKLDAGAMLTLDGQAGYGQVVGKEAMEHAIARAKLHGSCVMVLGNAHHLGRIGHWAEMAVREGLVSIHFVNVVSHARVAPYAGADARFGTNPVTVGIPLPGEPPLMLDFATSAVAQGKMRVAHNKGEKVADGLLIDDRGNPTNDPRYVVVPPWGALLTTGAHKGYGLSVVCELLGGALSGGGTWHYEDHSRMRVYNGMFTVLVDPARLGTTEAFARETRAYLDWLRQCPPAPGHDKVRIAGEPEREWKAKRLAEGIPVDEATWEEIVDAGTKLKMERATLEKLAQGD